MYEQWRDYIVIEDEGEDTADSYQLEQFLEYIRLRKVVSLEELGNEFGLDGKTTAQRLIDLEASGVLTGVIDDRGKFIYITEEELLSVKKYIEQRGRVSRAELVTESNRLIRLEATSEDKAKIEAEEQNLMSQLVIDDN